MMKKTLAMCLVFIFLFSSCTFYKEDENSEIISEDRVLGDRTVAVWMYYNEIKDLVNRSENETEFAENIAAKLETMKKYAVNTLILHVRAFDDAFYISEKFPVSRYCADKKGKLKFDVLKCFINECSKRNIRVWAWVNPYRINLTDDTSFIKKGYFAYKALKSENSQILIRSSNGIYYNPADKDVKKHIIDGIREILENYDVDGIHFDDYFYPVADKTIDSKYYGDYKKSGGKLSLDDFRRENVNSLIRSVYSLVRKYNKVFSVSPMSNIKQNYNGCFADVELWATADGYVDYIIPQIYFGFKNPVQPFAQTVQKWVKLSGDSEKLIIGLAVYKTGKSETYLKSGQNEWKSGKVISGEIEYICKNFENIGFSYYSASFLYNENNEELSIEQSNILKIINIYFP